MTITINIPKTAEQCAALLEHIQSGEEILLAQGGIAIARVVPISLPTQPRIPGQDKGKVAIASDFNAPLPENILNDFVRF
ncbi:MAG: type II toxin-antitoxin system Phd/YefM family antitoxin [Stigonema ocellatum SAG 48.90 = DSM 106950]|nr:type II toxin-antitoxin system Phd/YefM family antitoxin [Stigonema ocellatum SAG 48.90 = DSM 106950]